LMADTGSLAILAAMTERDRKARVHGHLREPQDVPRLIRAVTRILGVADGVEGTDPAAARSIREAVMRGLAEEVDVD
jgi:hypothetical protein